MKREALSFLLGVGFGVFYAQTKQHRNYNEPVNVPNWFPQYIEKRGLKESILYQTYLGFRGVSSTFFENQVVQNIKGFNFFKIYTSEKSPDRLICIFNANENLCFHEKILHGGATSLLLDNLYGYLGVYAFKQLVATAYINVTYKKPLHCHHFYIAEIYSTKMEGKKLFVEGRIYPVEEKDIHQNHETQDKIPRKPFVQSNGLMVKVDWSKEMQKMMRALFSKESPEGEW